MPASIPCDVVILPGSPVSAAAMAASERLAPFDSFFVLKDGAYFPHVSLYMVQLQIQDLSLVEERLATIAGSTAPLLLRGYRYEYLLGFVDAEYEKTPEIVGLQESVIGALNPVRDGLRAKDVERMRVAEGTALKNFQTFGYKYVGELFRPHLTLSRLKADNPAALKILGQPDDFSGAYTQLGLFEMGDNGTCIRKIAAFDFAQQ